MRTLLALALVLLLTACGKDEPAAVQSEPETASEPVAVAPAEPELDPATSLKMAGDWQLVRANCVACHSGKLITQQRGSAEQWLTMIRWMQKKQNLWQFDPVTEEKIIGYLAEYYPPGASQRRAALPPDLRPPNPYKQ
jgi:cytochrome c5